MPTGHFVRISHKEVSVSHPDGIRAILLAPLRKVWINLSCRMKTKTLKIL